MRRAHLIRRNEELIYQVEALRKENSQLRVQVIDIRNEANQAIEAKENEIHELCDQLGELKDRNMQLEEANGAVYRKLQAANRDNKRLLSINEHLASFLGKKKYEKKD